jgi:hypothetical protein
MDGCFASYSTLRDMPDQDKALHILRRCAYIVGPIMRRQGWWVPSLNELPVPYHRLGEMHPAMKPAGFLGRTNKSCLRIGVKVRSDATPDGFMDMYEVVQTMLHELAHMYQHGHGLGFYMRNFQLLIELKRDIMRHEVIVDWWEIPKHIVLPGEVRGFKKVLLRRVCGDERKVV